MNAVVLLCFLSATAYVLHNFDLVQDLQKLSLAGLSCLQTNDRYPESYCHVLNFHIGSLSTSTPQNCELDWSSSAFGKGGQQWLFRNLVFSRSDGPSQFDYVIEHAYFIEDVYERNNPWHNMEDLTHLYEFILGFRIPVGELVIVLINNQLSDLEPYLSIWLQMSRSVILLRDLDLTIVKHAYFSVHGGISVLSRYSSMANYQFSPFMMSLRSNIKTVAPTNGYHRLFLLRGSSKTKDDRPERNIANEQELAFTLRDTLGFLVFDMGGLTPAQQFELVSQSNIIVAVHGAALGWVMWMPETSHVVEISLGFRCHCFDNLSAWLGHSYHQIDVKNRYVDIDRVRTLIRYALKL